MPGAPPEGPSSPAVSSFPRRDFSPSVPMSFLRAPGLPSPPQNVQLLPLTPGPSVRSGSAPDSPAADPGREPGVPAGISGCPGSARWGGSGPSNFSFLQVTGSSNPAMISQDVPKHPGERFPFKPKLKTMRIITKDLIRDLM